MRCLGQARSGVVTQWVSSTRNYQPGQSKMRAGGRRNPESLIDSLSSVLWRVVLALITDALDVRTYQNGQERLSGLEGQQIQSEPIHT